MFQELTGTEYLKCEIACKHDKAYEKATWNERLEYFETLDFTLENTIGDASNPIGLRAAYTTYTNPTEPTGYVISLDACSSGLQLLSLLVSCPISWELCGGSSDHCESAYKTIYDAMDLNVSIDAKTVKNTIMTSLYGSTSIPESVFKDDIDLFYDTMEVMAPGAWELNQAIQELWNGIDGPNYDWVMPDNFHCCIETESTDIVKFKFLSEEYSVPVKVNERPDFHKGLGPNLIHSVDGMVVREMTRRCMFDMKTFSRIIDNLDSKGTSGRSAEIVKTLWSNYKNSGFLSVRILDYLYHDTMGLVDPIIIAQLMQSLPDKPFEILSVHDCFRCHPNYGNDLRQQYNIIMADINDSRLLQSLASQVTNSYNKVTKIGKIKRSKILEGNYLLA